MEKQNFMLGIVGLGGMGNWHRELIETIDGLEVAGIYDISEARVKFAEEVGVKAYESLDALLEDERIDIVLVSTPNDLHNPIAIKAMRAGKNVVSEKPVTLSSKDLQEMIDVSKETGKLFTVHQNRRWDEDFLTMKKIYDEQLLGDVYRIESRVHGSRGIPGDWRQEKEHGGGMVLDWGVHLLDQILLMMGTTKLKCSNNSSSGSSICSFIVGRFIATACRWIPQNRFSRRPEPSRFWTLSGLCLQV